MIITKGFPEGMASQFFFQLRLCSKVMESRSWKYILLSFLNKNYERNSHWIWMEQKSKKESDTLPILLIFSPHLWNLIVLGIYDCEYELRLKSQCLYHSVFYPDIFIPWWEGLLYLDDTVEKLCIWSLMSSSDIKRPFWQ